MVLVVVTRLVVITYIVVVSNRIKVQIPQIMLFLLINEITKLFLGFILINKDVTEFLPAY